MKKITQIEIGGRNFYFENDALNMLENYTARIKELYNDNGEDLKVADVESRIADICSNKAGERGIVDAKLIEEAIKSIGIQVEPTQETTSQETDKEQEPEPPKDESNEPWYRAMLLGRKLFRSPHNGYIAGVISGLAAYLGTNVALLRILTLLLFIVEPVGSFVLLTYIVMWIVFPKATSIIDYTRLCRVNTKGSEESQKAEWKENYERTVQELALPPAGGCLASLVKLAFYTLVALFIMPFGILLLAIIIVPICFFGILFSGNFTGFLALPQIVLFICFVLVAAIILFAIIYWILKKFRVCKPMKRWAKATLIILLVVSTIVAGLSLHRTIEQHGGYKNLEQIITTEIQNLTSLDNIASNIFVGGYTSTAGTFYINNPIESPSNKHFASLWDDSTLPFIIEAEHNDEGEYNIYLYSRANDEQAIASRNCDVHYTLNTDILHGALYFIYDSESNTIYIDEEHNLLEGTRHSKTTKYTDAFKIEHTNEVDGLNFGNATERGLQTFAIFFYGDQRTPSLLVGGNEQNDGLEIAPSSTFTHIKGLQTPVQATSIRNNGQKDTVNLNAQITIDHDKVKQTMNGVKHIMIQSDSIIKNAQNIIDVDYTVAE